MAAPEVLTYSAFTERLWLSYRGPGDPALLMPRQSRALWERVIAESPESERLLGPAGLAAAAEDAWRRVAAYGIDLDAFRPERQSPDFAAFLGWARAYRTHLDETGWIDRALLDAVLAERAALSGRGSLPFAGVGLADFETVPAEQALLQSLAAAGIAVETLEAANRRADDDAREWAEALQVADSSGAFDIGGAAKGTRDVGSSRILAGGKTAREAVVFRCADPARELESAADWAACAVRERPNGRFAIVIPDLDQRRTEVLRAFEAALRVRVDGDPAERLFVAGGGAEADLRPLVGAALNALELVLPGGGFPAFSRWLRSPFWQHTPSERAAAAIFEARWREKPAAQISFLEAYRHAGLRERLLAALPDAAQRIDAALTVLGSAERRSPAAWAAVWPRVLDALGGLMPPRDGVSAADQLRDIEEAFREVALLSPVTGDLHAREALDELERCLAARSAGALPIAGVHVLADLGDVGPGYAGLWMTGAVDGCLPAPVRVNPFLPLNIQAERGMPWSTPTDALRRSRALLHRALNRVPEVTFSWPARIRDETMTPSPLIRALRVEDIARSTRIPPRVQSAPPGAGSFFETVADAAPPFRGTRLPGGTAALNAQSICPIRAFCEHRLGARPLPAIVRGLSPGTRGRALHGALERLYRRFEEQAAVANAPRGVLDGAIARAAVEAAAEAVGTAYGVLGIFAELEAERIAALLKRFTERELDRAPFRIDALEREATVEIRGRSLRVRLDRIDTLESSALAVIDYKSGAGARPSDWLGDRPRDVQLPLYATMLPQPPAALVLAVLRPERIAYAGLWEPPKAFPGRPARGELAELIEGWRTAIGQLVDEFAAGDVRIFAADREPAAGPYAPLTRVYEQPWHRLDEEGARTTLEAARHPGSEQAPSLNDMHTRAGT